MELNDGEKQLYKLKPEQINSVENDMSISLTIV